MPSEHILYRPRHGPRQRIALVAATIFFGVPLLLLLVGVRAPAIENRRLAEFPEPAEGWGFFTALGGWATDHVPLRGAALSTADVVSRGVFGEPPPYGQGTAHRPAAEGPVTPPDPGADKRMELPKSSFPLVIEGRQGWLYLGYDVQGACVPDRPMTEVMAAMRRLRAAVEASGRRFVVVVPPNKTTMVPEMLPDRYLGSACAAEARAVFWDQVVPELRAVDVRGRLIDAAIRQGALLYTPPDTHWTHQGALIMTRAIAEAVEPGITESWRAMPGRILEQAGDLPPMIGQSATYRSQGFDLAPDGVTVRSRTVDADFRSALGLGQGPGEGVVGQKIGMIADSFSEPAKSYLDAGFSDLIVVHADGVGAKPRAVAKSFADAEVIVFEVVERSLVGGENPVLDPEVLDTFVAELARHPR